MTVSAEPATLPPLDSSSLEFDVGQEIRRTVVDLIRGAEPTTILGLLLANADGIEVARIAARLNVHENLVNWNLDKLEDEDLCVRVKEDGSTVALPLAPYTPRNE